MNEQPIDESTEEEFIEFLELDDDDFQDAATRKSFRIPIHDKERYSILINGISFPIEDINVKGAGVVMVEDRSFVKGMLLSKCDLILGDYRFVGVDCEIVHITSIEDAFPRFGIKWLNLDFSSTGTGESKTIEGVCEALKEDLLNKTKDEDEDEDESGNGLNDLGAE